MYSNWRTTSPYSVWREAASAIGPSEATFPDTMPSTQNPSGSESLRPTGQEDRRQTRLLLLSQWIQNRHEHDKGIQAGKQATPLWCLIHQRIQYVGNLHWAIYIKDISYWQACFLSCWWQDSSLPFLIPSDWTSWKGTLKIGGTTAGREESIGTVRTQLTNCQEQGRRSQPNQEPVRIQHEPRNPHSSQCHCRLLQSTGVTGRKQSGTKRICRYHLS